MRIINKLYVIQETSKLYVTLYHVGSRLADRQARGMVGHCMRMSFTLHGWHKIAKTDKAIAKTSKQNKKIVKTIAVGW